MDFGKGGVAALQDVAQLPRWPAAADAGERDAVRFEETRIRDDFTVYGYVYDNRDLDAVVDCFTADCVVHSPRGEVHGADELRKKYQENFAGWNMTRHVWANVLVRIVDPASEAYLCAYHHTLLLGDPRSLCVTGTDIRKLRKVDGDWKIAERWLTIDTEYELAGVS
jgi:ketosteroid isomerase-like protein